jgi:hypothetical protein
MGAVPTSRITHQMKRKTISKAVRFEVLKRDKFQCQYCGAVAPKVLLEVDHITPVAKNGDNDVINLITGCFDCNRGKRDKLLSDDTKIIKQRDQLAQLQERREQLEMMMEWYNELKNLDGYTTDKLKIYWENLARGTCVTENEISTLRKWIKEFEFEEILRAMDISSSQYLKWDNNKIISSSCTIAFSKIGGILFINKKLKENPDFKDILHIKNILKSKLGYYNEYDANKILEYAISIQIPIRDLKSIAYNARNWNDFFYDVQEMVDAKKRYK